MLDPIRIVSAASLFDGHDAAINIMRRRLQSSGAELIHLGHDRSAHEVAKAVWDEDAHAIALTSYQGGHMEYLRYVRKLLDQYGLQHVQIFAGGGGTILPSEIQELQNQQIAKVYSPDDGRSMGLDGMIHDVLQRCEKSRTRRKERAMKLREIFLKTGQIENLPALISACEFEPLEPHATNITSNSVVIGITGPGGAGKSSLLDEIAIRFLDDPRMKDENIAILCVDPTRRKGGALLGDRLRINSAENERVYFRSLATRRSSASLSVALHDAIHLCRIKNFKLILVESSGTGQSDSDIIEYCKNNLYVMTPEYGAATQLEKTDMLEFADFVVINKSDRSGADDARRDIERIIARQTSKALVFNTISSRFKDPGTDTLYNTLIATYFPEAGECQLQPPSNKLYDREIIPSSRKRYLSEISSVIRNDDAEIEKDALAFSQLESLQETLKILPDTEFASRIQNQIEHLSKSISSETLAALEKWQEHKKQYQADELVYKVRDREIKASLCSESLSENRISRIALPENLTGSALVRYLRRENLPGEYPFTAGVFPLKRTEEDPTRMFAGEGAPERTNRRFHYLSANQSASRLSTAFDSVTLYGRDAHERPDIFGKIGNAGVSICTLDDLKKLYSGFDLLDPYTSVSMTINGPAAAMTAFFLNVAIDQQVEKYLNEHGLLESARQKIENHFTSLGLPVPVYNAEIPAGSSGLGLATLGMPGENLVDSESYQNIANTTLKKVRGTVQADILKEDQAQNTCIFSTEFSLQLMADQQEWFIKNGVRNFYSVSISGYHMAEAGANPITQLAFTLANGFTYVEYYLARGMNIDDFAPNFSFFFSNGLDPEYTVIGRVARRIWARAMRRYYKASKRSQMLKYHIQTSGRSLHAQEIDFNDIRTTIQALYALADNCNSLHTNPYDEAITTPTEDSVRRAVAIQMILNKESGILKNENPFQGSYYIEALTNLVEQKTLEEFDRITERGGVISAMERGYQRGKIQDESHKYESLKNSGELPIIGVNTFLSSTGSPSVLPPEVFRSSDEEKNRQIENVRNFNLAHSESATRTLHQLKSALYKGENSFSVLLSAVRYNSLGRLTELMFETGGRYRRNM